MKIIHKIKQLNRNRLQKRKAKRNQKALPDRTEAIIREALADLEKLDPAAYGAHHINQFLNAGIGSMVRQHQLEGDFTRLMRACQNADVLFFAPWISRGGADKVTITLFRIAQKQYGEDKVKIILTEPNPFKAEINESIRKHCLQLVTQNHHTSRNKQIDLLTRLIHFSTPKHCINLNSSSFWDSLLENGKIIADATTVSAAAFCTEILPDGRHVGYSYSHLRHCTKHIQHLISDNIAFKYQLINAGIISESTRAEWHFIRQPADFDFSFNPIPKPQRHEQDAERKVLWASRICYQKNWIAAVNLAKIHKDIQIEIWGEGPDAIELQKLTKELPNIKYRGHFDSIADVTKETPYDLFLYTSHMDGIPNILLEIGSLGIPIVSTTSGAITDLLTEDRAYLIPPNPHPLEIKEAINKALHQKELSREKAKNLIQFIQENHTIEATEQAFLEVIK